MSAAVAAAGPALRFDVEDGGVAVITFDLPGESVNKFTPAVIDELAALLDRLHRDANLRAAVLISGKHDIFVAGADIEQFLTIRTASDGESMSAAGQLMMDRIARLRTPIVAAIHGACLGGGLEAALACAYRIASDHPKTVLGLPEVMLGLIPGAGGTQRLPRTVGLRAALDMILTGKNIRAKKALPMGLVDEVVHPAILREIAVDRARKLGAGSLRRSRGRIFRRRCRRSRPTPGGWPGTCWRGRPTGTPSRCRFRAPSRRLLDRSCWSCARQYAGRKW